MKRQFITAVTLCLIASGCGKMTDDAAFETVSVRLRCDTPLSKSSDPDQNRISDINVFVFNENGELEDSRFIDGSGIRTDGQDIVCGIRMLCNTDIQVFACANTGFRISGISSVTDLEKYRYYMSYPDAYSRGIPMSGSSGKLKVGKGNGPVTVQMKRLMARISLSIDRSALDRNVRFNVRSVRIGGCPKSAAMFSRSKATGTGDVFGQGFMKRYGETDGLNIDAGAGISREVDVYMLENMQGELLPEAKTEADKVLDISDAISAVCSYIEMKIEYTSDSLYTGPEEYLTYRFYLGDSPSNFDVERNCHYHLTVKPTGAGVPESSWRVDKSGLSGYGATNITLHPGSSIAGKVGDDVHLWAETSPSGARVTFGMEELEYDRERGIYNYTMDDDGRGVTLHLKNKGSGIVYVEAGAPASDAAMAVITVD